MERAPWPEPTRLSPYFFKQVVSHVPPAAAAPPGDDTRGSAGGTPPPQGYPSRRPEAAAGTHAAANTSPPSPSPERDSTCALGVNAGVLDFQSGAYTAATARPDAGTPVRVTSDAATDAAIWKCFTPYSYRFRFEKIIKAESAQTESLRGSVAAAWRDVERIQKRNAVRRATLNDFLADPGAPWRAEVRKMLYWQTMDIVQRYGFEVDLDDMAENWDEETWLESREHVKLDFPLLCSIEDSVPEDNRRTRDAKARPDGSSSSSGGEEDDDDRLVEIPVGGRVSTPQRPQQREGKVSTALLTSKALTAERKALLNPCNRRHFLRRIFAPVQRERNSLPKWTSLLLNQVLDLQKNALRSLEQRVQGSVYFKVPMHRPFYAAQAALQVCARQNRVAPEAEVTQVQIFRQLEEQGHLWEDFVSSHESFAAEVAEASETERLLRAGFPVRTVPSADDEITHTTQRWSTAEKLWTLLFDELDRCKHFFAEATATREAVRGGTVAEMNTAQEYVRTYRGQGDATMTIMRSEAEACAEMLSRNCQRTAAAVEEMENTFSSERSRLKESIAHGEARLKQLEDQQEKSARRVREALKAFFMDQMQYEEASQALLQDHLSLTQLETSHNQLRSAVEQRRVDAEGCEKETRALQRLLSDCDAALQHMFDACDAHCDRMKTDNYFIQCRLVDQCTQSLQQRCRCVQAIAALYEQRYTTLEARAGDKWQLQFLLSSEREWAVENLNDARAEYVQLERDWIKVRSLRDELGMDPAKLDVHVIAPKWSKLLDTLRNLDAPPSLQRRLPTLRSHSATMARPVSGCGPQAVRQLLSDTAAAAA